VVYLTSVNSVPVSKRLGVVPFVFSGGYCFRPLEASSCSLTVFSKKCPSIRTGRDTVLKVNNDNEAIQGDEWSNGEGRQQCEMSTMEENTRKQSSSVLSANACAKMKKVNSSSCSKLLTPPSILSSAGHASRGRKWAHHRSIHRRARKNITPSVKGLNTISSRRGSSDTFFREDENSRKHKMRDGLASCIPLFTFMSDDGAWESASNDSQLNLKDSLFENGLGPSNLSFSAIEGVLPVSELFYRSNQSILPSLLHNNNFSSQNGRWQNNGTEVERQRTRGEEFPPSVVHPQNHELLPGSEEIVTPPLVGNIMTDMAGISGEIPPSEVVRRELMNMVEQEQEEQRQLSLCAQLKPIKAAENDFKTDISDNGMGANCTFPLKQNVVEESFVSSVLPTEARRRSKSNFRPKSDHRTGRKMVRRGMEMLVGGEPINADPPQRSIELNYHRKHPKLWARAITTNSPDFGPLLHMHSAGKVEKESIGLFCEHFVDVTRKWGICSDDLKSVVSQHETRNEISSQSSQHASEAPSNDHNIIPSGGGEEMKALPRNLPLSVSCCVNYNTPLLMLEQSLETDDNNLEAVLDPKENDSQEVYGVMFQVRPTVSRDGRNGIICSEIEKGMHLLSRQELTDESSSWGQSGKLKKNRFCFGGTLKISLNVSMSDLREGRNTVFHHLLCDGIGSSINAEDMGLEVHIRKLVMSDLGCDLTDVTVNFQLNTRRLMGMRDAEIMVKQVHCTLASAIESGKLAMALARIAGDQGGLLGNISHPNIEDILLEAEGYTDSNGHISSENVTSDPVKDTEDDGPFGMDDDVIYAADDIWLGGGNGGVFFDYSKSNYLNSFFKGELGPYLVDAATERARQNQPRVIAIGDVHGCIDELKALLKKCDYHPGDMIVFLGDLVCKGPDSLSVVQMARELGAIGVRGNHDFEVVRWHQAIKSGADPPVIGSEHYYVASSLTTADLKWMYSLPWFISSSHLNALFVHAGFVSGIRLAKQNPRLMMNMRSILPDGTVTSKFFNNWPWARLWDGPQTVFFGHDADRGLQQYEHAIGLDTGCVYGGKLTACVLPERRIISVNAKREYFQYRRKHFD